MSKFRIYVAWKAVFFLSLRSTPSQISLNGKVVDEDDIVADCRFWSNTTSNDGHLGVFGLLHPSW